MSINANQSKRLTVHCLPITQARINLGQLVKRVHVNKEYFILEKDGIPVAGILDAEELEDYLELRDPKACEDIRKSREEFAAGKGRPAEALLAAISRIKKPKKTARPIAK